MKFIAALSALLAVAAAGPIERRDAPPAGSVKVTGVIYGGTGCPQGSADPYISNDGTALYLNYDNKKFTAVGASGSANTSARKFCQVTLRLNFPAGWQYAVAQTVYAGNVRLNEGSTAQQTINYYFSGETNDQSSSISFKGPINSNFVTPDVFAVNNQKWSSCESGSDLFNIHSSISVSGTGSITISESATAFFVGLNWKKC